MTEPLLPRIQAQLSEKLGSPWFNVVQRDIVKRYEPAVVHAVGESMLTDMLRAEPKLPFVRSMIDASPGIAERVATVVDGRVYEPEIMFKIFGEAAIVANTLEIEVEFN